MLKQTLSRILKIQLVRQLLGGIGGALVALAVYTVYSGAHDAVRAYLLASPTERPAADKQVYQNKKRIESIGARARKNVELLHRAPVRVD